MKVSHICRRSGKVATREVAILVTTAGRRHDVATLLERGDDGSGRRYDVVTLLEIGGDISLFLPSSPPSFGLCTINTIIR